MSPKRMTRVVALVAGAFVLVACAGALAQPAKTGFIHKKYQLSGGVTSDYVVFVPHHYDGVKEVPVILFLHGSGETKGGAG